MLTKLLRFPVPGQIKALLEKIDSEGASLDSSSRRRIRELLDEDFLTRYEKFLLKRGLRTYKRAKALDDAMCIVLNQPDEIQKELRISREAIAAGQKGATVAMWNGTSLLQADPRAIYGNANR